MAQPDPSERRRSLRLAVKRLSVLYHPLFDPHDVLCANPSRKAVAADLSREGARLVTTAPLPAGTTVRVQLMIPALRKAIYFKGQVVRCSECQAKNLTQPQYEVALSIGRADRDYLELLGLVQVAGADPSISAARREITPTPMPREGR